MLYRVRTWVSILETQLRLDFLTFQGESNEDQLACVSCGKGVVYPRVPRIATPEKGSLSCLRLQSSTCQLFIATKSAKVSQTKVTHFDTFKCIVKVQQFYFFQVVSRRRKNCLTSFIVEIHREAVASDITISMAAPSYITTLESPQLPRGCV